MGKLKLQLQSILRALRGSVSLMLAFVFVILLFFEALVVKTSIQTIFQVERSVGTSMSAQLVRINFPEYNKVVKRIQDASSYQPEFFILKDPFGAGNRK